MLKIHALPWQEKVDLVDSERRDKVISRVCITRPEDGGRDKLMNCSGSGGIGHAILSLYRVQAGSWTALSAHSYLLSTPIELAGYRYLQRACVKSNGKTIMGLAVILAGKAVGQ